MLHLLPLYLVSLVNSYRLAKGMSTVGFLNPTLYASNASSLFTDITSGINNYCANNIAVSAFYCASGFSAAAGRWDIPYRWLVIHHNSDLFTLTRYIGWDPVTGLGSMKFTNLAKAFGVTVTYTSAAKAPLLSTTYIAIIAALGGFFLILVILYIYYYCLNKRIRNGEPQQGSTVRMRY